MIDLSKVKQRFELAKVERNLLLFRNNMIYRHVIPNKNTWVNKSKGQRPDIEIYNSAPMESNYKFAKTMVGICVPPGTRFFNLQVPVKYGSDNKDSSKPKSDYDMQLESNANMLYDYLQMSTFRSSLGESFQDLGGGTAGVHVSYSGDIDNPLRFESLDMSQLYFTESSKQILDNVFREIKDMDIDVAKALYPKANFDVGKHNSKKNTVSFIEAVCYDEEKRNYYHCIYSDVVDCVHYSKELKYNPFILFRYDKRPNEFSGVGVAARQLGNIITANLMVKWLLISGEMMATPPLMVANDAILNTHNVSFAPNEMITVKASLGMQPNQLIQRLPMGGNPGFTMEMVQGINSTIDNAYQVNQLNYEGQPKTATEIQAKLKEAVTILGDVYNRIVDEGLSRVINTTLIILEDLGLIPIINVQTGTVDKLGRSIVKKLRHKVTFQSPLDDIRQQANNDKLLNWAQLLGEIAGAQVLAASIKGDKLGTYLADNLALDKNLINSPEEMVQNLQQHANNMMQQQQLYTQQNALYGNQQ